MATLARSSMSSQAERDLHTLFKRCVQCPPDDITCPKCGDGEICSLVPQSCHTCAHMTCIADPNPAPVSSGPNVGAIAGGVVGGVAFVAALVFLVYWFWIKKRRQEQDAELEQEWANDEITSQKRTTQFSTTPDAGSTRTRGSLANSILSRASNIIQIAYIPGVTNRNGSGTNSIHAPVPPIPAAYRSTPPKSPLSNEGDALFFRPGDLRDSTWSGTSSLNSDKRDTRYSDKRDTQYTMASISPSLMRDSVASEAFMDDASSQPMPATAATRIRPHMVSVKSSNSSHTLSSNGSGSISSPKEGEDDKPKQVQVLMPGQGQGLSPNSSVRSAGKAKQVTVGGGNKGRFPIRQLSNASTSKPSVSSPLAEKSEEEATASSASLIQKPSSPKPTPQTSSENQSLMSAVDFATPPAIQPLESPFFDASEHPASSSRPNPYASMGSTIGTVSPKRSAKGAGPMGGLSAVIEEAAKRSSGASDDSKASPFSDEHATDQE